MKKLTQSSVLVVACLMLFATAQSIQSQDKKAEAKKDAKKTEAKKEANGGGKRLPNFYGQLSLTEDQKKQVYAIQDKYEPEIAELREKIKKLQNDRDKEARGVLKEDQIVKLDSIMKGNKDSQKEGKGSRSPFRKKNPDGVGDSSKPAEKPAEKKAEKPAEKKAEKK